MSELIAGPQALCIWKDSKTSWASIFEYTHSFFAHALKEEQEQCLLTHRNTQMILHAYYQWAILSSREEYRVMKQ